MDDEGHVVADCSNNRIQFLTKLGKPVFKFGDSGSGKLYHPTGCIQLSQKQVHYEVSVYYESSKSH